MSRSAECGVRNAEFELHKLGSPVARRISPRSALRPPPSITLHIEELVLHGFAPRDRHRIGAAVEQELTRLLTEHPWPSALKESGPVDRVDAGAFRMASSAKPATVGGQIANAVHGGLSR